MPAALGRSQWVECGQLMVVGGWVEIEQSVGGIWATAGGLVVGGDRAVKAVGGMWAAAGGWVEIEQ